MYGLERRDQSKNVSATWLHHEARRPMERRRPANAKCLKPKFTVRHSFQLPNKEQLPQIPIQVSNTPAHRTSSLKTPEGTQIQSRVTKKHLHRLTRNYFPVRWRASSRTVIGIAEVALSMWWSQSSLSSWTRRSTLLGTVIAAGARW